MGWRTANSAAWPRRKPTVPMYEYRCPDCEQVFEELIRNRADEESVACPSCDSTDVKRLLSAFAVSSGGGTSSGFGSSCGGSSRFT